jgi:hypothetical protein
MTYEATGCQTYRPFRRDAPTLDKLGDPHIPLVVDGVAAPPLALQRRIVRSHNDCPLRRMGDWT